jgi:hypothetical protein
MRESVECTKDGKYAAFNPHHQYQDAKKSKGYFEGFLGLAGTKTSWAEFRNSFGLLAVCRHFVYTEDCDHEECKQRPNNGPDSFSYLRVESKEWVITLACGIRSTIRLGNELRNGRIGDISDWDQIGKTFHSLYAVEPRWEHAFLSVQDPKVRLKRAREKISEIVTEVTRRAGISLRLNLLSSSPGYDLTEESFCSVWPAIVLEWGSEMANGWSFFCDGCNEFFPVDKDSRDRRPRNDRRQFCPSCKKSPIPAKLRKRDQRARQAQATRKKKTRPVT